MRWMKSGNAFDGCRIRVTALARGVVRLRGGYVMSMYVCTKETNEGEKELGSLGGVQIASIITGADGLESGA